MRVKMGGRMVRLKPSKLGMIVGSGDLQGMKSSKKSRRCCKARVAGIKNAKRDPKQKKPAVCKQRVNTKKGRSVDRSKTGFRKY